jgi:hypothetical protein
MKVRAGLPCIRTVIDIPLVTGFTPENLILILAKVLSWWEAYLNGPLYLFLTLSFHQTDLEN